MARAGADLTPELWEFLRASELMMLDLLNGRSPAPQYAGKGDPESGCLLYYLHHPPAALVAAMRSGTLAEAAWMRATHYAKPMTAVTPGDFERLRTEAMPQAADVRGWLLDMVNLLAAPQGAYRDPGCDPYFGALRGRAGQVCLGIIGDNALCGSSTDAPSIMNQMRGLGCDYAFHLGDLSQHLGSDNGDGAAPARSPSYGLGAGRMFALNSRRAMCSGGDGYFAQVLGNSLFAHQNMTSYFGAHYGKWVILGLDTACHGSAASLYTRGVLGEEQSAWIQECRQRMGGFEGRKLLVLTHHAGQDFTGAMTSALHQELTAALGRAPDVWYWAQHHGAIAYSPASAAGAQGTKARCVGHASGPCGLTPVLAGSSGHRIAAVDYFSPAAHRQGVPREPGAFASLELTESGGMIEKFYVPGRSSPIWQSVNGIRFA